MTKTIKRRVGGPAWTPGPVLTAGEIAQRLQPIAPDVAGTVQKIRYWQRREMLLPVSQVHAGTGKHFQYPASAVFDAAILHAAVRVGLTISDHRHLVDGLTMARLALPKWLAAKKRGQELPPAILHIWQAGGRTEVGFGLPSPDHGLANYELMISIDCGRLWSKVWKEEH